MGLGKAFRVNALLFSVVSLSLTACGGSGGGGVPAPEDEQDVIQTISLSNFQAADVVVGQADFSGRVRNQGGSADANTFNGPSGSAGYHNGVLYLSDYLNDRVLGFNSIPVVNNDNADFVLGQVDFTTTVAGLSATKIDGPQMVAFDEGKMFLVDGANRRVLIWNSAPTTGNPTPAADVVLGQSDFISKGFSCSATGMDDVYAVWAVDGKLIIADTYNNRVLIWSTVPASNGVAADIVLGQQSFDQCAANDVNDDGASDSAPTASTLNAPSGIWSDGTRLVVLDDANHRALIWNSFPTTSFAPADIVLGQSAFDKNTANDDDQNGVTDAVSARTLNYPYAGVYSNGEQLFITDTSNHRVLVWSSFPTASFTPADVVLGQGDFEKRAQNDDDQDGGSDVNPSARTLAYPGGVIQVGSQLIVTDHSNHRHLIYSGQ